MRIGQWDQPCARTFREHQADREAHRVPFGPRGKDNKLSKKLYVGNLSFDSTEDDLKDLFGRHGTVESVAAHSLYEKSDPYRLYGPGGHVDLTDTKFEQHDERPGRSCCCCYRPGYGDYRQRRINRRTAGVVHFNGHGQ